jgi:hypothetical protein
VKKLEKDLMKLDHVDLAMEAMDKLQYMNSCISKAQNNDDLSISQLTKMIYNNNEIVMKLLDRMIINSEG